MNSIPDEIIDSYAKDGRLRSDLVDRLCEAAEGEDPAAAREAVRTIFPGLIERLNDSFDPGSCELYDRIFGRIIEYFRRRPGGSALDTRLRGYGIEDEAGLLERKGMLLKAGPIPEKSLGRIRKAILLSRVTIGADVAVTSVMADRLKRALPGAELVIMGSRKLRELYGGDGRIRVREISYDRGGTLLARLLSWLDVADAVEGEISGLGSGEFLVIDPDSRLTQLGLLPVVRDDGGYRFFQSRSFVSPGMGRIGELASAWIGEMTGSSEASFPFLALPDDIRRFGVEVAENFRGGSTRPVVTVSFGVGGNHRKRVSDEFEGLLAAGLLRDCRLILDKGATAEERSQVEAICRRLEHAGYCVLELDEVSLEPGQAPRSAGAGILTWDGGIGRFASLIASSDLYIGYDSAGQHLAAALGIPTVTVLVNSNSPAFAERWRPYGRGRIQVVEIEAGRIASPSDLAATILGMAEREIMEQTKIARGSIGEELH